MSDKTTEKSTCRTFTTFDDFDTCYHVLIVGLKKNLACHILLNCLYKSRKVRGHVYVWKG